jgi:hypothetical protein
MGLVSDLNFYSWPGEALRIQLQHPALDIGHFVRDINEQQTP